MDPLMALPTEELERNPPNRDLRHPIQCLQIMKKRKEDEGGRPLVLNQASYGKSQQGGYH